MDGQLGLEDTPEEYVAKLVEIFREARRVLRDDGTLWLNLGDSYAQTSGSGPQGDSECWRPSNNTKHNRERRPQMGVCLKPKDLIGIPWRTAFALQADGWYLRCDIIWSKPNPMPESVKDRPTKAHEYIFLMSKNQRYYYDADAIKEGALSTPGTKAGYSGYSNRAIAMGREPSGNEKPGMVAFNSEKVNKRSVWTIPTQPFPDAHFAVFPPKLIEPCILAGSAEGDIVLDPFCGSGTTCYVAKEFKRNFIGIDINPKYLEMAELRTSQGVL